MEFSQKLKLVIPSLMLLLGLTGGLSASAATGTTSSVPAPVPTPVNTASPQPQAQPAKSTKDQGGKQVGASSNGAQLWLGQNVNVPRGDH